MESSIAEFLMRWSACELLPTCISYFKSWSCCFGALFADADVSLTGRICTEGSKSTQIVEGTGLLDHGLEKADSLRGSSVKIGMIQRRLAWPLRKGDTHKLRSVEIFYRVAREMRRRAQICDLSGSACQR